MLRVEEVAKVVDLGFEREKLVYTRYPANSNVLVLHGQIVLSTDLIQLLIKVVNHLHNLWH